MIDKNRLTAITDGVLAIAATIMVLELEISDEITVDFVMRQMPTMIAYIISFVQIFLAWHEHHDALANCELINHRIFLVNCLWLFFITLLPFITGTIGRNPDNQYVVLLYIGILLLVNITLEIECAMIVKQNKHDIKDAEIIRLLRKVTITGYLVAAAISFVSPLVAICIVVFTCVVNIGLIWRHDIRKTKTLELENMEVYKNDL